MEKIRNFRDLNIWQLGVEIVEDIYRTTKTFPKEELYQKGAVKPLAKASGDIRRLKQSRIS